MEGCTTFNRRLRSKLPYLGKSSRCAAILQKSSAKRTQKRAEKRRSVPHLFAADFRDRTALVNFFNPNIPHVELGDRFDLNSKKTRLVIRGRRVIVDQDGHDLPIDDVDTRAAPGDHRVIIPVVSAHEFPECRAIADISHQAFRFDPVAFDDLPAPRDDAHRRVLRIKLAGINLARPEVGLRAGEHPRQVDGAILGRDFRPNRGEPWNPRFTAILKARSSSALDLDLKLQGEVFGFKISIHQITVPTRILLRGFAYDTFVLDAPKLQTAVPAF